MNVFVLLLILAAQDEARMNWEGFGVGSSVILRVTKSTPQEQKSSLDGYKILRIEEDAVVLRHGRKELKRTLKKSSDARKVGVEDVDVDGKTFSCGVYELTVKGGTATVRQWLHREVPGRVVKEEITRETEKYVTKVRGRLVQLNQRFTVAGKAVAYAVYEYESETSPRDETGPRVREKATRWISEDVPGFLVKEETRETSDAGGDRRMLVELVDFEVK